MKIRKYKLGEEEEIWNIFFNTTHHIVGRDYTKKQVAKWAPEDKKKMNGSNVSKKNSLLLLKKMVSL